MNLSSTISQKREVATANRAFNLCTILHQLTVAEQKFQNTHRGNSQHLNNLSFYSTRGINLKDD